MKTLRDAKVVSNVVCKLGESPYWDESTQTFRYVDMLGKKVISFQPENNCTVVWKVPDVIGCVNPIKGDDALIAMYSGIYYFSFVDGKCKQMIPRDSSWKESVRFNDGKCDAQGKFWVGTTDVEREKVSHLFRVDKELNIMAKDLVISNGLAWSEDGQTMYFIDTWPRNIWKAELDSTKTNFVSVEIAFDFDETLGNPDGMTIDQEGMLWIAFTKNGKVCQFNPETKEHIATIELPIANPTSCAFGGADLKTLYITSAILEDTHPDAGKCFSIELEVGGYLPHAYSNGK